MARMITSINDVPVIVDSDNPDVVLEPLGYTSNDSLLTQRGTITRKRVIDVSDFGAKTDGTDASDAILKALDKLKSSKEPGTLRFPAGTIRYTRQILFDDDCNFSRIQGSVIGRTILDYRGPDEAIYIDTHQHVEVADIKVRTESAAANGTTHGIHFGYNGSVTGFGYLLANVHVVGFDQGAGLKFSNCEHLLSMLCRVYGCLNGVYMDNSNHTGGALGISNAFICTRVEDCLDNGWDVGGQSSASFDRCQGFSIWDPSEAQFVVRGNCNQLDIRALDIEYHGLPDTGSGVVGDGAGPLSIGLKISGTGHKVQTNGYNLLRGISASSCTNSTFFPQRFSSSAAGVLLDSGSNRNIVFDTNYQITDQGVQNDFIGNSKWRTVSANYTLISRDHHVSVDATAAARNITLYDPTKTLGREYIIRKTDASANVVNVLGTMDGVANRTLTVQHQYIKVESNGTGYLITGGN